jgi:hypothetical protein
VIRSLEKYHFEILTAMQPHHITGKIYLWHFDIPNAIGEFCFDVGSDNPTSITRLRFNESGNTFGASTGMCPVPYTDSSVSMLLHRLL